MSSERRQSKKVIAWGGDFGMDQYVSWSMSNEELMLDTIWEKFEEFCNPQSNEVRARFDLLTTSHKETSQWMSGIMLFRPRLLWLNTSLRLPRYFTGTFFYSS